MIDEQSAAMHDAQVIEELRQLNELDYERSRRPAAKALGCRVAVLDRMVESARTRAQLRAWTRESVVPQPAGESE